MKRFKQHDFQDCGIACIKSILYENNITSTYPKLREVSGIDQNGTNMYDMIETSILYGLNAQGLSGNFTELIDSIKENEIKLPIIAHIIKENKYYHYIIIEKINKDNLLIFDPAEGKKNITIEFFKNQWTGYIISFDKKIEAKIIESNKEKYDIYTKTIKKYKWYYLSITILLIFSSLFSLILPYIFKELVDSSLTNEHSFFNHINTSQIILLFIFIISFQFLINIISAKKIEIFTKKINNELADKYFEALLSLPLSFFRNRKTGDILSRLTDLNDIVTYLSLIIPSLISNIITCLVVGIILLQLNIILFSIVIFIILLYFLTITLYKNIIKNNHYLVREKSAMLNSKLKEFIDGIETIKSLSKENYTLNILSNDNNVLMQNNYNLQMNSALLNSNIISLELTGLLILLFFGINLVKNNIITMGSLIMFESLFYLFTTPIKNIIENISLFIKCLNSAERLADILDSPTENNIQHISTYTLNKKINFDQIDICDVTYKYNSDNIIINNLNLTLLRTINYGIIGESGIGKSTIMKLITSLEKKDSGKILVDGIPTEKIPLDILRKNILYVPQNMTLFNISLKDNLIMKDTTIEDNFLEFVIDGCCIKQIMEELNINLNYLISENGSNFSGGQRQMIAIARSLLRRPKFIIFDESFNQINNELCQKILMFINTEFKNISIIHITHDHRILTFSDEILNINEVLKN